MHCAKTKEKRRIPKIKDLAFRLLVDENDKNDNYQEITFLAKKYILKHFGFWLCSVPNQSSIPPSKFSFAQTEIGTKLGKTNGLFNLNRIRHIFSSWISCPSW